MEKGLAMAKEQGNKGLERRAVESLEGIASRA
jgi:hypothetical protein